jgi:hypothetical protein
MDSDIATRFNFSISGLHNFTSEQDVVAKSILTSIRPGQRLLQYEKPHAGKFSGDNNRHTRERAQKWFKAWFGNVDPDDKFTKRVRTLDFRTVCFNCHISSSMVTSILDTIWPYTRRALLAQIKSSLPRSYRDDVCNNVLRGDLEAHRVNFLRRFNFLFGITSKAEAKIKKPEVKVENSEVEELLAIEELDGADTKRAGYEEAARKKKALRDTDFKKELKETMTHDGGIKNLLELWKVTGKFKARSREDNAALETIYKNDLETAALVDTEYNIHPDRAKLINSELISLVKEIAKLNIGFEEFDLLQAEINNLFKGLTVLESTTLISSGS